MRLGLSAILTLIVVGALGQAATAQDAERIVTPEDVSGALERSPAHAPLGLITTPHGFVTRGMEKGLIYAERNHLRERLRLWSDRLRELGIGTLFGGMGEQTGFGGGGSYTARPSGWQNIAFLARGTLARYQEFDIKWTAAAPKTEFSLEASHQWRPKENFYGLGHRSSAGNHTDFALSQTWVGARVELRAPAHFRWGVDHRLVATKAVGGTNNLVTSTPDVFPDLPALGSRVRLLSTGTYFEVDFMQDEYDWGGKANIAASYQQGMAPSRLRYFNYEWRAEGRMPVVKDQSGLVGQFNLNLNHENRDSDPIPFYMRPRIGGSSTLRGFALDRFYGKNLILMSLEYRYALHPNFQSYIYHDAGQIFDRAGELTWFNWHRNYGIGLRLHNNYRTVMRLEYAHSREGFDIHLIFGDRVSQPLAGVTRSGTYRR